MSLSDKEKILKEPLSLYEQEAFYKEDVKESIKRVWNKKRKEKGCKEGQEVITAEDFFEEFGIGFWIDKIFGADLCSESGK